MYEFTLKAGESLTFMVADELVEVVCVSAGDRMGFRARIGVRAARAIPIQKLNNMETRVRRLRAKV